MNRKTRNIVVVAVFAAGLSACGGGDDNGAPVAVTPPPVTATPLEDMFGAGFGTRYRTAANTQATDPVPADINPVSLTTQPVTI